MASHTDPELDKLLEQYVCVRMVQMGGVDLSVFQFDPFQTWAVFVMNGDKTIYGRYGSASPKSKRNQKDSNPNPTMAGLKAALRKGLELHASYGKDPKGMGKRLAGKTGAKPRWRTIESTPAARKYGRLRRIKNANPQQCAHCHELARARVDSYLLTRKRIPDRDLWLYPRPSVVLGLTLDRDHCARVTAVAPGSLGAQAGFRVGDDIAAIDDQPLISIADVQFILQQVDDKGAKLRFEVRRGAETKALSITLKKGWRRQEDFGWRYRVAGYAMWLWGGVTVEDHARGIRVKARSPRWFKKTNKAAYNKLQAGDLILAVDGKRMSRSDYIAYLMRDKRLGSTVNLDVERGGRRLRISFPIPGKQPEVLGH